MKLIKALSIILFINYTLYASNNEEVKCACNIQQSSVKAQTGGLYKPSSNGANEYMKTLVVFVQFDSTDVDVNNFTWPKDQLPTWANDLISSSPSSSYPDLTISDYWKDMSMGSFDFIGDVYPNLVTINTEDYYKNNGYHFGECNKDALTQINPYVDFSDYDKWSFNSTTKTFEFSPDGYVDMIIMIYRTPKNERYDTTNVNSPKWFDAGHGDFNAVAILSDYDFTLNFDGVQIFGDNWISHLSSGLTIKKGIKSLAYTLPILAHEYGHLLFGAGHGNTGGIMSGSYSLSAVERERLGHIAYTNCTQNNFSLTLKDFITDGDVLRIPVPITNQNSSTFFLVENHQKVSKYDQIIRGGSIGGGYDYTDTGSGIYVWLVKNGNSAIPSVNYEAVTADGRWDWTYDGDYYAGPGWYPGRPWEGYLPKTKKSTVNRNTGKTDKKEEHIYWNSHWANKWVDINPLNKEYEITRNVMGDEFDAYNFGYNELLTPWSNPSTYVNGTTNISIQLYNESGNDITIKVYTSESSGQSLKPSTPQNVIVTRNGYNANITWTANIEPDVISGGKYKVYRAVTTGGKPISWSNVATVNHPTTSWTDPDYYFTGSGNRKAFYCVSAVDNTNKESLKSNYDWLIFNNALQKGNNDNLAENKISDYELSTNYPNPFNPETNISFSIKESGFVSLRVFDILGKEVASLVNERMETGNYTRIFNASNLPSGIYIYSLRVNDFSSFKKMTVLK